MEVTKWLKPSSFATGSCRQQSGLVRYERQGAEMS